MSDRFRSRRSRLLLVTGLLTLAVAVTTTVVVAQRDGTRVESKRSPAPATAPVTRGDLVATESLSGTLEHAEDIHAPNWLSGTVTWLPEPGTVVERGEQLYRIDDRPVLLLYGKIPPYREFAPGMSDGNDVRQLERNLAALGYTGFDVDREYTEFTARAVKRWQRVHGLKPTGRLERGRVLFVPGAARAGEPERRVGDHASPGDPVLAMTSTRLGVSAEVKLSRQHLVRRNTPVTVVLPDGKRVAGKVTSVGSTASRDEDRDSEPTVAVRIALTGAGDPTALSYAPVQVEVVSDRRREVLSVPVAALLALGEGGYGVQVVDGDRSRIVRVEAGLFAKGRVEITGRGIRAGTTVGMPKL
ncbi:peptidoglycan-binding protein [Streptomyces sp. NPDC051041]|uniref:peptidoglycan-binding protein n=1 Tax=Streptomyces sp. NPDC051041 TaxID=3365640 RepID=UPI0037B4B7D1